MKIHFLFVVILIFVFQFASGCSPETDNNEKTETFADPQIQALEKAKKVENDLMQSEQDRAEQMREQGI